MSVSLKFTSIQLVQNVQVMNEQSHLFELEIFSKEHKENMKFTFHTVKDGLIDLPSNFFIVAESAQVCFRIEEKNQKGQLERVLSFGEYDQPALSLYKRQGQHNNHNSKKIVFETFNKKFKVTIAYLCVYDKNTVFTGHFYDLLKNQGYSSLNLISLNESMHKQNMVQDEATRQFTRNAPEVLTLEGKKVHKPWHFKNCFKLCDQEGQDRDFSQVEIQEQLPPNFSQNVNKRLITPKKKAFGDLNNANDNTGENDIKAKPESQVKAVEEMKEQKNKNENGLIPFFKGQCRHKNLFSCIDASVDEEQITIIQPVYR